MLYNFYGNDNLTLLFLGRKDITLIMSEVIEKLAEAEHIQWQEWAKSVSGDIEALLGLIDVENLDSNQKKFVSKVSGRIENWSRLMIDYADLSEDEKEKDRVYARIVYEICKNESV